MESHLADELLPWGVGLRHRNKVTRKDRRIQKKKKGSCAHVDSLVDFPELVFHREPSAGNYYLLAARPDGVSRDQFIRRMAHHHSVQCVVQYYPLYGYPFIVILVGRQLSETDNFYDNMVSFPLLLSEHQIDYVIEATRETLAWLRAQ